MKTKTHVVLFLTAMITLAAGSAFGAYSGGTGEPNTPYQIATKADLLALAANTADYSMCFILTADVNLQGQVFTTAIIAADTSATSGFQGTAFTGTFGGSGHKITNFTINGGSNWYLGLFGLINSGGSVKNLGLENYAVSGFFEVGGLVGMIDGSISNCYSTGTVSGSGSVGGLVGWNKGSIINCYSTGQVSGRSDVGGLVGGNESSIINCYSTATVSGSSGSLSVGGLVGLNYDGSISNCYSTGTISGSSNSYGVGGLVGSNSYGSISNCYSTGTVSGSSNYVGGLMGWNKNNNNGSISNCYSMGAVSGGFQIGGLVGKGSTDSVVSSFWDVNTSGQTTSAGGTGKTTAKMKTLLTFTSAPVSWDFTNETTNGTNDYWRMCVDGVDYPRLNWESTEGDFACPDGVSIEDLCAFVEQWLLIDCASSNNYCGGADMDYSGKVNMMDFAMFAQHWLEGI